MKAAVVVFVIALGMSCIFAAREMPAYPIRPGILDVKQNPFAGVVHEESIMPDLKVIDGYRPVFYTIEVRDTKPKHQQDFPLPQVE